jgi:hypothetical protein
MVRSLILLLSFSLHCPSLALQDTDSLWSTSSSLVRVSWPSSRQSDAIRTPPSTPTFMEYGGSVGAQEAYPAQNAERQIPGTKSKMWV